MDYTSLSDSMSLMTNGIQLMVSFITTILYYIGLWNMFSKAGVEGWKCIIPYYNTYVVGQISKKEKLAKIVIIVHVIAAVVLTVFVGSLVAVVFNYNSYDDVSFLPLIIALISGIATCMLLIADTIMRIMLGYYLMKSYDAPTVFLILVIMFPYVAMLILGFSKKYLYNGGYGDLYNRTGANIYNTRDFNQPNNYNNGYYSQNQGYGQQNGYYNQNQNYGQQSGYYNQNLSYGQNNGYNTQNQNYGQQSGYYDQNQGYGQNNGYNTQNQNYGQQSGYYDQNQSYGQNNGYNTQNQNYGQQNGYYNQNQSYGQRNGYTSYNESSSVNTDSSSNNETDNSESSDDTFSL